MSIEKDKKSILREYISKIIKEEYKNSLKSNELIAYHGTDSEFDEFDLDIANFPKAAGNLKGFYFAKDKNDAKVFGDIIITVKLKYNKMFTGNPFDYYAKINNLEQPTFGAKPEDIQKYYKIVNQNTVKEFLLKNGYDIVYVRDYEHYINLDQYMVFDKKQIEILKKEKVK